MGKSDDQAVNSQSQSKSPESGSGGNGGGQIPNGKDGKNVPTALAEPRVQATQARRASPRA
jgi:hypothetical protein